MVILLPRCGRIIGFELIGRSRSMPRVAREAALAGFMRHFAEDRQETHAAARRAGPMFLAPLVLTHGPFSFLAMMRRARRHANTNASALPLRFRRIGGHDSRAKYLHHYRRLASIGRSRPHFSTTFSLERFFHQKYRRHLLIYGGSMLRLASSPAMRRHRVSAYFAAAADIIPRDFD